MEVVEDELMAGETVPSSLRRHLLALDPAVQVSLLDACRGASWSYPCLCVWAAGVAWATWSHTWNQSKLITSELQWRMPEWE